MTGYQQELLLRAVQALESLAYFASRCSSQDGGKAMWSESQIAAFKPVCDDILYKFVHALTCTDRYSIEQLVEIVGILRDVMQEIQRASKDKANTTPA